MGWACGPGLSSISIGMGGGVHVLPWKPPRGRLLHRRENVRGADQGGWIRQPQPWMESRDGWGAEGMALRSQRPSWRPQADALAPEAGADTRIRC